MSCRGGLDFEGLEEARELLISPKQRRRDAGLDVMLTPQGPAIEKRRERNKRRIEWLQERKAGVKDSLEKFRALENEGYDARQIALQAIVPRTGRKVSAKALSGKLTLSQKL